jgi:quinol monooxygenase YgiN
LDADKGVNIPSRLTLGNKEKTMTTPLTFVATLTPKSEAAAEFLSIIEGLTSPTLKEEGCIDYNLHHSHENPNEFVLIEHWRSRQDLDDHFKQPYTVAAINRFPAILSTEIRLQYLTHLPVGDARKA